MSGDLFGDKVCYLPEMPERCSRQFQIRWYEGMLKILSELSASPDPIHFQKKIAKYQELIAAKLTELHGLQNTSLPKRPKE